MSVILKVTHYWQKYSSLLKLGWPFILNETSKTILYHIKETSQIINIFQSTNIVPSMGARRGGGLNSSVEALDKIILFHASGPVCNNWIWSWEMQISFCPFFQRRFHEGIKYTLFGGGRNIRQKLLIPIHIQHFKLFFVLSFHGNYWL